MAPFYNVSIGEVRSLASLPDCAFHHRAPLSGSLVMVTEVEGESCVVKTQDGRSFRMPISALCEIEKTDPKELHLAPTAVT